MDGIELSILAGMRGMLTYFMINVLVMNEEAANLQYGATQAFVYAFTFIGGIFADKILNVGPKGLGFLMSAAGLGALFAALNLARMGDYKYKGRLLMYSSVVFCLALMAFALSKRYEFSLFSLLIVGWAGVTSVSIVNTILQIEVPDEFRGRVMSAFMFTFGGLMPFGNFFAGALANVIGAPLTIFVSQVICLVIFAVIGVRYKQVFDF